MNSRDEHVLGALIHREQQRELDDNRAEWEAQRDADLGLNVCDHAGEPIVACWKCREPAQEWRWPTREEMCAREGAERAAVEGPAHEAHVAELARNKQQRGTAA